MCSWKACKHLTTTQFKVKVNQIYCMAAGFFSYTKLKTLFKVAAAICQQIQHKYVVEIKSILPTW